MKRTMIDKASIENLPCEFETLMVGATVFDSSCSREARVYFIDRDGGYYLKRASVGALEREAKMTAYFHSKGLSCEVLSYLTSGGYDWMLTSRVSGEDCTHAQYLSEPKRLAVLLGERLRELHSLDFSGCPIEDRMSGYLALAEENYARGAYDLSYFYGSPDVKAAWREVSENGASLSGRVLLHGDYCLPNVMLDDWRFSGFIDVGNGGVGDPHIDLFWGAWTLNFNLHTEAYRDIFFDAYGRDAIELDKIKTVSAFECFG